MGIKVKFKTASNGTRMAFKTGGRSARWIRVNTETAEMLVSTGQAERVDSDSQSRAGLLGGGQ